MESTPIDENTADLDLDPRDIGSRVAGLRRSHGWSQAQLATRAGLSRATIARLESGATDPLRSLRPLSRALGLPLADLLALELEATEIDSVQLAADLRSLAARAGRLLVVAPS